MHNLKHNLLESDLECCKRGLNQQQLAGTQYQFPNHDTQTSSKAGFV